ncbi:MAG TPA: hypothetical protein VLT62_01930 [Candidatus Methylomirabilis sp.]|nr:hypothetical protein [Candidatus Methylomirabilis sp.]
MRNDSAEAFRGLLADKLADSLAAPLPQATPRRVHGAVSLPGKATAVVNAGTWYRRRVKWRISLMRPSSFLKRGQAGPGAAACPLAGDFARPRGRFAVPRRPRLEMPGSTVHGIGRCDNREFCFRPVPGIEVGSI